jgi:hypothetical protein
MLLNLLLEVEKNMACQSKEFLAGEINFSLPFLLIHIIGHWTMHVLNIVYFVNFLCMYIVINPLSCRASPLTSKIVWR